MRLVFSRILRTGEKPLLYRRAGIRERKILVQCRTQGKRRISNSVPIMSESTVFHTRTRTPGQERVASIEHERMKNTTPRLLSRTQSSMTPAEIQEFRAALHYWVQHRTNFFSAREDCTENAEALLDWLFTNCEPATVEEIIKSDKSLSGALIDLIEQYMEPLRSTHRSLLFGGERRLRQRHDVQKLMDSLEKAAKTMRKMQELHADSSYHNLLPDHHSCNSVLDLWAKRCWFLQRYGDQLNAPFVASAMDGISSVSGCLDAMRDFIGLMERSSDYPSPNHESYNNILSALSHSRDPSAAVEARALLQQMEKIDNTGLATIPYNTVLNLYASLAEKNPKFHSEAAALLHDMRQNQQPDAISYATVLLAYANAGKPEDAQRLLEQMEAECEQTLVSPNTICFNTVIDAWAKSDRVSFVFSWSAFHSVACLSIPCSH